jgi:hypothetical protein
MQAKIAPELRRAVPPDFEARWMRGCVEERYVKPRRQLVVSCKRKPTATRGPTAVNPSPGTASPPVVIGSDVDAGGHMPVRDAPF